MAAASPAERYRASRRRAEVPLLTEFAGGYPFGLDPFQLRACTALEAGHGVLVAAPTGAGKTVVGEFAVHLALSGGGKCFYTTPIKALSNQKYADLLARYGPGRVGLLTGDTARDGDAPVVVMTTEVLRNMLYAGAPALRGLRHVVMDEVHYLSDRFRGAVWEEVIVHLPEHVVLTSLSATVSNAEEFGEWLTLVRGRTEVVVEEHRPVPLWQHMLAGHRLYDLFAPGGEQVNPALVRLARQMDHWPDPGPRGRGRPRGSRRGVPDRVEVVERLDREGLLPAITFVFSRAGCDAAVGACRRAGLRLTSPAEQAEIRASARDRTAALGEADLAVLGFWEWLDGLERGVAAHHAGLLPVFKEVTEELFLRGLVKAVFATETLALGVNMPARSVVLERLNKFNGESHADITPGEYTQLTGRAGRRGIDVEGHAVVLLAPGVDPVQVAGLASRRTYPLRSSFQPSYNMAVNLLSSVGPDRARELLELSFAQFQADRSVAGLRRQVTRTRALAAEAVGRMSCQAGDLAGYLALRRELTSREAALARAGATARRAAAGASLARLRPGDVVHIPGGRSRGTAVVVASAVPAQEHDPDAVPGVVTVVTADRSLRRVSVGELPGPIRPLGRVRLPRGFSPRSPQSRRDLVSTLRAQGLLAAGGADPPSGPAAAGDDVAELRARLRAHPCHGCPDREEHLRWAHRHSQLERDTHVLEERIAARAGSLARMFDRICAVLTALGYLDGTEVTPAGRALARVYAESDLVVVECLRRGLWSQLDAPGLAAVVSTLLFEGRRGEEPPAHPAPAAVRAALQATVEVWGQLHELEAAHRLDTLRAPDPGFAWAVHRWASGAPLATVLVGAGLQAGDFVRWCRQVVDLLDQLAGLGGAGEWDPVPERAQAAVTAIRRSVVAQP